MEAVEPLYFTLGTSNGEHGNPMATTGVQDLNYATLMRFTLVSGCSWVKNLSLLLRNNARQYDAKFHISSVLPKNLSGC